MIASLREYLQVPLSLTWSRGNESGLFYVFCVDNRIKHIQEAIDKSRGDFPIKLKFRINQEDRRRQLALVHSLGLTTFDSVWPVLFGLVLVDPELVGLLVGSSDVGIAGRHPLTGEWIETVSRSHAL